jgi:hypothetical protein
MLVTFESKTYANITMFGDVAEKLIKAMGHSGTIPSAIKSADLLQALEKLKCTVSAEIDNESISNKDDKNEDDEETPVSMKQRALPLIELLESAIERGEDVMWHSN